MFYRQRPSMSAARRSEMAAFLANTTWRGYDPKTGAAVKGTPKELENYVSSSS